MGDDLIAQFKRQPNTEALMAAGAKQLQALYAAQEQLNELRWLTKAEGKQLDGIGEIVVLSRSDAAKMELGKPDAGKIDDEAFRKYLYYKMFLNTSAGTRKDVYKALRMFWNRTPLFYSEDPNHPATMFFTTPMLSSDIDTADLENLFLAPKIKPAGVALKILARKEVPTRSDIFIKHLGRQTAEFGTGAEGRQRVRPAISVIKLTKRGWIVYTIRNNVLRPVWKAFRTSDGETMFDALGRPVFCKEFIPEYVGAVSGDAFRTSNGETVIDAAGMIIFARREAG
jgi:hypothetical protein